MAPSSADASQKFNLLGSEFLGRENAGTCLGRKLVHPSHVSFWQGKADNGAGHSRRKFVVGVENPQPNLGLGLQRE